VSRTANEKRPEELRDAIVGYLVKHGLTGLSLRPLAKAVGSSPRVLLYYFGSKEKMVVTLLAQIREQQRVLYGNINEPTWAEACLAVWKQMSSRESEPSFRLFFEAYGMALQQPTLYKSFLNSTIDDWLREIGGPMCKEGYSRNDARAFSTVVLAGLRGFMLDYCTTHDRKRLDQAVRLWLSKLDSMLPAKKRARKPAEKPAGKPAGKKVQS
jgi:AcrR family transcriptional regulator